jgi:hypothetical protein
MQPYGSTFAEMISPIETGLGVIRVSTETNGRIKVHAVVTTKRVPDEWIGWFDPKQGYALVRETRTTNGIPLDDIEREYQQINNLWVLKSLVRQRLKEGGFCRITVQEVEINIPIDEQTFDLRGFGLVPRTRVVDKTKKMEYTLHPSAAVEEQVRNIMATLDGTDSTKITGSAPASSADPATPRPSARGAFIHYLTVIGGLFLALIAGVALWLRRRARIV